MIFQDPDLARIADYLGMTVDALCSLCGIKNNVFERTHSDCPFLDDDGTCTIHEVKPHYCAQWPYIKLHNRLDKLEEACAECVGLTIKGRA